MKCQITGVEFKPDLIFDKNRLSEAKKLCTIALTRLTKNLPDFESVVKDLKDGRHYNPASLLPEQNLSEWSFLLPQAHVS